MEDSRIAAYLIARRSVILQVLSVPDPRRGRSDVARLQGRVEQAEEILALLGRLDETAEWDRIMAATEEAPSPHAATEGAHRVAALFAVPRRQVRG